jgi:beta-lactamase class A
MEYRATKDLRVLLASALAIPVLVAIVIPLYLSGNPDLLAKPSTPTQQIIAVVPQGSPTATQPVPPSPTATKASTKPTTEPEPPVNEEVAAVVDELLAGESGIYGVIIEQPGEDPDYRLNADLPFLSASLYKLVLLADIYDGMARGTISEETVLTLEESYFPGPEDPSDSYFTEEMILGTVSIDEALFATGAYSSNVAAHALLSLTDEISLEATARELGMESTYFYVDPRDLPDWPPSGIRSGDADTLAEAVEFAESQADEGELMLTTPRDIATFFDRLLSDEVVNEAVSAAILDILKQQAVDDRFPCLLPFETEMAHKTGNLDHVVHDAGIIWTPDGPVILVAMVENAEDDAIASQVIQQLALIAYHDLDEPALANEVTPDPTCGA